MARVSVPFTEGHYYGREERPNTELADNSLSIDLCVNNCHISLITEQYCKVRYYNMRSNRDRFYSFSSQTYRISITLLY